MIIIEQQRHLDKELPQTAYCEKHGLFTDGFPNVIEGTKMNEMLGINKSSFMKLIICPYCKAEKVIRICKQRL